MHHQQILEHGGLPGIRSGNAFEAALARPEQRWFYGELQTIPQSAAAYAQALVTAHAFADGNKRTGFLDAAVFLGLNGPRFQAENASVVFVIQRLAAGHLDWMELEAWFENNSMASS